MPLCGSAARLAVSRSDTVVCSSQSTVTTCCHSVGHMMLAVVRSTSLLTVFLRSGRSARVSACRHGERLRHKPYGDICEECEQGKFSGAGLKCLECQPGLYAPSTGMHACTVDHGSLCGPGKFGKLGATAPTPGSCSDCGAGRFSPVPKTACPACAHGQYQPLAGQTSCVHCPLGQTQWLEDVSRAKASSCAKAAFLQYSPYTCGVGTYGDSCKVGARESRPPLHATCCMSYRCIPSSRLALHRRTLHCTSRTLLLPCTLHTGVSTQSRTHNI